MNGTCENCPWRKPDKRPEYPGYGQCRRHPPQIAVWTITGHDYPSQPGYEQHWPWMAPDDWCGEFQEKPND